MDKFEDFTNRFEAKAEKAGRVIRNVGAVLTTVGLIVTAVEKFKAKKAGIEADSLNKQ